MGDDLIITLTKLEAKIACLVGDARHEQVETAGLKPDFTDSSAIKPRWSCKQPTPGMNPAHNKRGP